MSAVVPEKAAAVTWEKKTINTNKGVSDMSVGKPTTQATWNTRHASTYLNMRLSAAGAAKAQNDILLPSNIRPSSSSKTHSLFFPGEMTIPRGNFQSTPKPPY